MKLLPRFNRILLTTAMLLTAVQAQAEEESIPQPQWETFTHEGLPFLGTRIDPRILRQLSGLRNESITFSKSAYEEIQGEAEHFFSYDGLTIWIICAPVGSKECLPVSVRLTNAKHKAKYGLTVGSSTQQLLAALGEPLKREGNKWMYYTESEDSVSFFIRNSRIEKIEWNFYTG